MPILRVLIFNQIKVSSLWPVLHRNCIFAGKCEVTEESQIRKSFLGGTREWFSLASTPLTSWRIGNHSKFQARLNWNCQENVLETWFSWIKRPMHVRQLSNTRLLKLSRKKHLKRTMLAADSWGHMGGCSPTYIYGSSSIARRFSWKWEFLLARRDFTHASTWHSKCHC